MTSTRRAKPASRLLGFLSRRLPAFSESLKKWFVEYLVPVNRAMGIRIVTVSPDSRQVVLRLLPRRRNLNPEGTVHGAAMLALAETVHGVAVLWQFSPAEHRMVSTTSRMEFLAAARGELTTRFSLTPELERKISEELEATGFCETELQSSVLDHAGTEVARLTATYRIRRREAPVEDSAG
jgi:acyl-coenzyme A thioesterase PaaI-like protein